MASAIHNSIIAAIKKAHTADPHPAATVIEPMTDDEICRLIFINYRGDASGNPRGLALSQGGLAIMSVFFKGYEVIFEEPTIITGRHKLYLDRICTMPWYVDFESVIFFDPDLAMKAKLSGSIDALIQCFES